MKNHLLFSVTLLTVLIPANVHTMGGTSGSQGSEAYLSAMGSAATAAGAKNLSAAGIPTAPTASAAATCDKDSKIGGESTKQPIPKLTGGHGLSPEYQAQIQSEQDKKSAAATSVEASASAAAGGAQPAYSTPLLNAAAIASPLAKRILQDPPSKIQLLIDRVKKGNVDQLTSSEKVIFLVGPSGTGKTCMARAIAAECGNLSCYIYPAVSVGNEYSQSGNKNLQRMFENASLEAKTTNKPVVIVLDELQKLFENHSNEKDPSSSFITALWSVLESFEKDKVIFIGIFNPIKCEVPSQIKTRYGRVVIATSLPDEAERAEIIKFHINQHKTKKFDSALLDSVGTLAKITSNYCHRELAEFIKEAIDIAESRKDHTVNLGHCYSAFPAINDLQSRTNQIDKKTWREWAGTNWKFLTASTLSAAAIGATLYLGNKSLASQEKSNIFNRFMALISYQLSWGAAQKAVQPKSAWSWGDVSKHSESTYKNWNPAEIVRHLLKSGLTLADLGLDKLSAEALSLLGLDKLSDGMKKS